MKLDTLPSITFENRLNLPRCSAVYFALTATRDVLYIGKAICLRTRWYNHHRLEDLRKANCSTIAWLECSQEKLEYNEAYFINEFQPLLNNTPNQRAKIRTTLELDEEIDQLLTQVMREEQRSKNTVIQLAILEYWCRWYRVKEFLK